MIESRLYFGRRLLGLESNSVNLSRNTIPRREISDKPSTIDNRHWKAAIKKEMHLYPLTKGDVRSVVKIGVSKYKKNKRHMVEKFLSTIPLLRRN